MIVDTRVNQQSINDIYSNGLLTKPTPLNSMYTSGMGGFITGYKFAGDIYRKSVGLPKDTQLQETLDLAERYKNFEGQSWSQQALNVVGDMVGYSLNPFVMGLGGAGGFAARGLATGARYLAPKAVTPLLERQVGKSLIGGKPFTVGDIGERLAESAFIGEFSMVPLAFQEGSARVAHEGGAIGLALGSIPILLGMRKGIGVKPKEEVKKPGLGVEEIKPQEPLSELDQWHHDYDNKLDDLDNLQARATAILKKEGVDVNPVTHEVNFNLLNDNDVRNLQSAVTDSLTSGVSSANRNHLIDYIVNNKIDNLRSNPASQKMLRAYDNYLTGKLASQELILADANKMLENSLKPKINNTSFLSQPEIEKVVKKLSREESHVSQLPFTLPENIKKRISLQEKINKLKKKEPVRAVTRRIEELEKQMPKIMTPKEELKHIADRLIGKKEYRNKLKSAAYQRLEELADHWPAAKMLMERVKLQEMFDNQKAIKDSLGAIRKEVERPVSTSVRPNDVISYLKDRINVMKPKKDPMDVKVKTPEQIIQKESKVPADLDTTLKEQKEYVDSVPNTAEKLKEEFEKENIKIHQFKSSAKALSEFIQCVLGSK